jgi:acyl carrier protein
MEQVKTPQEIEDGICDAIARFGPERSEVTRDATLADLDVDSLDLVELAQIVEEDYGIRVETGDFKDVVTVGHAIDVVLSKVGEAETAL